MEALSAAAAATPRANEQPADPAVVADDAERGWLPSDDEVGPPEMDDEEDALASGDELDSEKQEEEQEGAQDDEAGYDADGDRGPPKHGSAPPELPPDIKVLKVAELREQLWCSLREQLW